MDETVAETAKGSTRSPLLTWVPLLAVALLMAGAVRRAARPIDDPDAWWHLRVGALFWDGTFTLTRTGPLSSFATEAWVPRDWLPQLIASKVEQWWGLPGVAWLYGASLVILLWVLYHAARRQSAPLLAVFATALGVIGAYGSATERPQMVSFILLALFSDAWLRSSVDLRARWWLIPLTWVWASSHGLWYIGVAMGVVVTCALAMDRRLSPRAFMRLATIPVASVLAAAVTPAGPKLLLAAFQTGDKWKFVREWDPPNFTTVIPAAAMLIVCLIALTWARRQVAASWVTIGLLLLGTALVLMAARTVAAGTVILVPVLAATLHGAMYGTAPEPVRRPERVMIIGSACLALFALALATPHTSDQPGNVPTAFGDSLDALPESTPILNDYALGGWFHWRHPELDTVIDGFTDGYTVEALEDYTAALRVQPGWEEYVRETGASVAILVEDSPLAFALTDRLGWIEVARDEGYAYLTASVP